MTSMQPVTIVGGGLAGLSLGIALRKAGVAVEVFEAGDYPRHRVCGEFVTGLDDSTIEKLGIDSAFVGAGCHRSVTWFLREHAAGRQTLPEPARAISRFALDARLAELFVAGGGKLVRNVRFKLPHRKPGLVQANGRRSSGSSPWMGLKFHIRDVTTVDDLELHLGDKAYVGLSSVEDGWLNVCGLFRRRPGLQFARDDALPAYLRASGLHSLAERLSTAKIRPASRCAVAGFMSDRYVHGDEVLRLGDACATIPPFTGNGMAVAFTSAAIAVDPLVAWARGERNWDEVTRSIHVMLRKQFQPRLAGASVLNPFFLNPVLQRCLWVAMRSGLLPLTTLYRLLH